MKEKDFLKNLNAELDGLELPQSKRLKDQPIAVKTVSHSFVRWGGLVAGGLAACLALVFVFNSLPAPVQAEGGCMRISVNPSVTAVLDGQGKVTRLVSENADGDTLVCDQAFVASVVGKTAEEAVTVIAERAAKTGYIDFSSRGENGKYNQITISYEGVGVKDTALAGVENALVEFFKQKGIFVYVETGISELQGGVSALKEWKERPVTFFDYSASTADGGVSAGEILLDYTQDLLVDCMAKYDLVTAIDENNEKIREEAGILFNYWTLTETQRNSPELKGLAEETAELLEQAYQNYGEDYRELTAANALSFELFNAMYESVQSQAVSLRGFADGEKDLREFTAAEVLDFSALAIACGYGEGMLTALQASLTAFVVQKIFDISAFLNDTRELISVWAEERVERFSWAYSQERKAINDEEYQDFLKKIEKI